MRKQHKILHQCLRRLSTFNYTAGPHVNLIHIADFIVSTLFSTTMIQGNLHNIYLDSTCNPKCSSWYWVITDLPLVLLFIKQLTVTSREAVWSYYTTNRHHSTGVNVSTVFSSRKVNSPFKVKNNLNHTWMSLSQKHKNYVLLLILGGIFSFNTIFPLLNIRDTHLSIPRKTAERSNMEQIKEHGR